MENLNILELVGMFDQMDSFQADATDKVYHALSRLDVISSSQIKFLLEKSPKHFEAKYLKGLISDETTDAMRFGSLVHCLSLTRSEFPSLYAIAPQCDRRTKAGKAIYQEWLEMKGDREPVKEESYERADSIADNLGELPWKKRLVDPKYEQALFWRHGNLKFRAKPDVYDASTRHLYELKTTMAANPSAFISEIFRRHYDVSLVHYREGIKHVFGHYPEKHSFLVAEKSAPYVCYEIEVPDEVIEIGHEKWLDAVETLSECYASETWPSYLIDFKVPKWAMGGMDERISSEESGEDELKAAAESVWS